MKDGDHITLLVMARRRYRESDYRPALARAALVGAWVTVFAKLVGLLAAWTVLVDLLNGWRT